MEPSNNVMNIHINDFDGPLELLLHLIKQSQMDIYDIEIEKITNQYVDYLNKMKELNVNVIGEYFVMASNLMVIKSKLLLPKKDDLEDEDDDYEDPRNELVNQLIIYQQYKEASKVLKKMQKKSSMHHSITAKVPTVTEMLDLNGNKIMNVDLIKNAFDSIIKKHQHNKPYVHEINEWHYTVKEQSNWILKKIENKDILEFNSLFNIDDNLEKIITTFLSILELMKEHLIFVEQIDNRIYIRKK
ncbi:segregation and condensation protein A [Apilactobacillus timberlakei]|uniref:Segregation and condensation protein A n=1 Tax=Apilactobacillus timberlakei TaxID=2008380 RepID=A0ABY2YVA8_9LACO|nr:segregation/condensation protein A [Apilactobacillus timberlakei]TPR13882.1 segregation/condensation protein A [Apilactobacillus timberlakei]TPR15198.1 segregation/condensation protein A [Apilactobacillus timberlakei]TPR17089.1 segregation/condensation protein A [Apilactobacillus timberlakei]TPR17491.1 segregation/condensation protein A [Apilactobacillus timberlakei]TPR20082.1 segregation/condensation protein A [Apilactobacillus timberlakei]